MIGRMSKVALARCETYDREKVFEAVKRSVDLLGGIEKFVKPGNKVLLKPNLLSARPPEEAVCTHPEVVRAVIRLVKAAGGNIIIGDSPGGFAKDITRIFDVSGVKKVAEEEGVELVKFTVSRNVDGIPFSRYIFDADVIISLPKLKTHSVTVLTCAVKNTYGTVVGLFKAEQHSRAPKEAEFAKVITKIHSIARPALSIVDGIVGMDGDGPSAGRPKQLNVIMAGEDAVSIDSCAACIANIDPFDVLITKEAHKSGLGQGDMSKIQVVGDDIGQFVCRDFRLPVTAAILRRIPRFVVNSLANFIRFKPFIDKNICKRCNLCKLTCPVHVITISRKECKIDYNKCVRCMCCHEVCPYEAISIKRNILTRRVWG